MDIEIRPVTENEVLKICELMNNTFDIKHDVNYATWQYFNRKVPTILFGAFYKNELIGCEALQLAKLSNGIVSGIMIDAIIHSGYRGNGVFGLIEKAISDYACINNIQVLWGIANKAGMVAGVKAGRRNVGEIRQQSLNIEDYNYFCRQNIKFENAHKSLGIEKVYTNYTDILDWKFKNNPRFLYNEVAVNDIEKSYVKLFDDERKGVLVGDIVFYPRPVTNDGMFVELIQRSCEKLFSLGATVISIWAVEHSPQFDILKQIGFIEDGYIKYLTCRILSEEYSYLYDFKYWDLAQADSEMF